MLTAEAESEIEGLSQRFGNPLRWHREYEFPPNRGGWIKKMLKRRGEVALVVPNAEGRVWLHTKRFYPASIYRLPSGGIHEGESIEDAAYRESYEEMGYKPTLARFVGVVENVFRHEGADAIYPTYILEARPIPGLPHVIDPDEEISGFRDIEIRDLDKVVEQLDSLASDWQPWGHFRAVPHALVAEALTKDEG